MRHGRELEVFLQARTILQVERIANSEVILIIEIKYLCTVKLLFECHLYLNATFI